MSPALADAIEVAVDGTPVSGWTFADGRVVFDAGAIPEEGDTIAITYAAIPTCE